MDYPKSKEKAEELAVQAAKESELPVVKESQPEFRKAFVELLKQPDSPFKCLVEKAEASESKVAQPEETSRSRSTRELHYSPADEEKLQRFFKEVESELGPFPKRSERKSRSISHYQFRSVGMPRILPFHQTARAASESIGTVSYSSSSPVLGLPTGEKDQASNQQATVTQEQKSNPSFDLNNNHDMPEPPSIQTHDLAKQSFDASDTDKHASPTSEDVISGDEVANFRGALHDDESPALDQDGKIIRSAKKAHSAYFPTFRRGSPAAYEYASKHTYPPPRSPGASPEAGSSPYRVRSTNGNYFPPSSSSPAISTYVVPTVSRSGGSTPLPSRLRGGHGDAVDSEVDSHDVNTKTSKNDDGKDYPVKSSTSTEDKPTAEASGSDQNPIPVSTTIRKGKRKARKPEVSSSDTDTSSHATLPPFDLADFKARRDATYAVLDAELVKEQKRGEELMEMLRVWNDVTRVHEGERAEVRVNTRIAKMQQEETALRAKEAHRDQVLGALKNVLGMLDDKGEEADAEDEDGDDDESMEEEDEEEAVGFVYDDGNEVMEE